jgi:hypothetical protein
MKLFTEDIDKKLFEQYSEGNDLENQVVVAKIFNPYGRGTWYLLNSDPDDPDYLWAIVDLFEVELGSVSRSELESIKVPPFNQHLERDLGFKPVNALELFNYLIENKKKNRMMAEGGKVYTHDIDIISKSSTDPFFMFPKPTTGKSMGIELKTGGNIDFNIQVGDSVWVDNPHWKASTGNENPVRRVVKMIIGDSIFFSDGSNSSIQYIKKLKNEKSEQTKENMLKEGDYIWNAVGKKLVVNKVTDDEYYLVGFGQISASPFSKSKIDGYISKGEWTLTPEIEEIEILSSKDVADLVQTFNNANFKGVGGIYEGKKYFEIQASKFASEGIQRALPKGYTLKHVGGDLYWIIQPSAVGKRIKTMAEGGGIGEHSKGYTIKIGEPLTTDNVDGAIIMSIDNPEWGTFTVLRKYDDGIWEIRGKSGVKILVESEFKFWKRINVKYANGGGVGEYAKGGLVNGDNVAVHDFGTLKSMKKGVFKKYEGDYDALVEIGGKEYKVKSHSVVKFKDGGKVTPYTGWKHKRKK